MESSKHFFKKKNIYFEFTEEKANIVLSTCKLTSSEVIAGISLRSAKFNVS